MYPGAEITTVKSDVENPAIIYSTDVLGYGITGISNLPNQYLEAQVIVDLINAQSSYASAAIAHPSAATGYPITEFQVNNYRGLELMSGLQTNFDETSPPATVWYSEQPRILSATISYFPSARAGGDYHGILTPMQDYVTYVRESAYNNKSLFDTALKAGRTTISQKGGLGYLKIDSSLPGDSKPVTAGTQINFNYWFKPVVSGTYTFYVYDEDMGVPIASETKYCTQNVVNSATSLSSFLFTGGRKSFSLYIEGADHIYSSPIIVHN